MNEDFDAFKAANEEFKKVDEDFSKELKSLYDGQEPSTVMSNEEDALVKET